jgi:hypothetical protein
MNPSLPVGEDSDKPMPLAEKWIRDHGEHFVGQWVALRDDCLVGAANSYPELRRIIGTRKDVLVTIIE